MSKGFAIAAGLIGTLFIVTAAAGTDAGQRLGGIVKGRIGQFFSWAEMVTSATAHRLGIDNTPPPEAQARLQRLVSDLLDPLRARLGRPVRVTSGYRAPRLNQAIHGSPTSQHMAGEAVDFKVPGVQSRDVVAVIAHSGLPFDQAIWYDPERGGHVHLSYTTRRANRRQVLHAPKGGGYVAWSSPTTT